MCVYENCIGPTGAVGEGGFIQTPPSRLTWNAQHYMHVKGKVVHKIYTWDLSALHPDSIYINFTPQSSRMKLDCNWIDPLRSCQHYEPNLWQFLHKTQLWSCVSILTLHTYTVLLTVTQSYFWISRAAGFGHCLLPIHTTKRLFPLDIFYKHVLQLMSTMPCDYFISSDDPLPIWIESTYQRWIGSIAIRSWSDRHKFAYAKTRTSADRIELDLIAIWSQFMC